MNCPKCGYPQYCPCGSCTSLTPSDKKTWIWENGNIIKCANCGLTEHADWWETKALEEFKRSQNADVIK